MAKGQKRSNREPKKPKAARKPAGPVTATLPPQPVRNLARPGGLSRKAG